MIRNRDVDRFTRRVLSCIDTNSFSPESGCRVEHFDGSFGYIELNDALIAEYKIREGRSGQIVSSYTSVERLLEGGWFVPIR